MAKTIKNYGRSVKERLLNISRAECVQTLAKHYPNNRARVGKMPIFASEFIIL